MQVCLLCCCALGMRVGRVLRRRCVGPPAVQKLLLPPVGTPYTCLLSRCPLAAHCPLPQFVTMRLSPTTTPAIWLQDPTSFHTSLCLVAVCVACRSLPFLPEVVALVGSFHKGCSRAIQSPPPKLPNPEPQRVRTKCRPKVKRKPVPNPPAVFPCQSASTCFCSACQALPTRFQSSIYLQARARQSGDGAVG